jgi:single-stranded-DNA-specific exonuclease
MGDKELKNSLFIKSQKLLKEIEQKKDIFILTNSTVDGVISGSILLKSIFNNKGNATIRCFTDNIEKTLEEIINEKHDYHIFTDFSSNVIDKINKVLEANNFLFINVNEITKANNNKYENIINPWLYSINGQTEISSSGLAYLVVSNFDRNSNNLSHLPIISAISKEQDVGEDKSLISLNNEILQTSLKLNIIEQKKRLDISEKETIPITNVLENNIIHYIKEITWNNEASLTIIKDSHITINKGRNTKIFNELDEKEFVSIYESIVKFLQENSKLNNIKIIKDLIFGYNYILINEETEGVLKNVKSFEKAIELCINTQKIGLAVSLCLGERGKIVKDVYDIVIKYNNSTKKICSQIFGEKWRFNDDKETIFINGEGILNIQNISSFISFLKKSVSFADRLICLRIPDTDGYYKFIITKTKFCNFDLNSIKEKVQRTFDKENNLISEKNKLEIKISDRDLEDFLSNIKKIIINEKISQSQY